jgi:hypothetical protein
MYLVNGKSPFRLLHLTVLEVENALLELDRRRASGPDDVPPLILQNCASVFVCSSTDHWQRAYSHFHYRGIAILSAIAKFLNCWCT